MFSQEFYESDPKTIFGLFAVSNYSKSSFYHKCMMSLNVNTLIQTLLQRMLKRGRKLFLYSLHIRLLRFLTPTHSTLQLLLPGPHINIKQDNVTGMQIKGIHKII